MSFPVVAWMTSRVWHIISCRYTNVACLACYSLLLCHTFPVSRHEYHVYHMSFSIDVSGMSIQAVMSMMSCVVSRMFQSYHGCHASVMLFLVSRGYPVVSGRRFWHINRVRRVTDVTRLSFHGRSSRHVCHASGLYCPAARYMSFMTFASKMSCVSHIASGQCDMDVSPHTCRVQLSYHRCLATDMPLPVVKSDMSIPLLGSITSCVWHVVSPLVTRLTIVASPIYRVYLLVSGHNITDTIHMKCCFRSSCHECYIPDTTCLTCRLRSSCHGYSVSNMMLTVVASQILRIKDVLSLTCRFRLSSLASQSKSSCPGCHASYHGCQPFVVSGRCTTKVSCLTCVSWHDG